MLPPHLQSGEEAGGMEVPHLSVCPREHGAHCVQHPYAAGGGAPPRDVPAWLQRDLEGCHRLPGRSVLIL